MLNVWLAYENLHNRVVLGVNVGKHIIHEEHLGKEFLVQHTHELHPGKHSHET